MTLDEWIALSPQDRNARRRAWDREAGEWVDLLTAAHARFDAEFRSHPLINRIGRSSWFAPAHEPSIIVTTALHAPQLIEELPDRFDTFRVLQEPILDSRDDYLRYWILLFDELLGWTEAQTREWARRWDDELNGRTGLMFYHDHPYEYALPAVMKASLPSGQSEEAVPLKLYLKLVDAIRSHASEPIWLSPYDWNAARERVNEVLKEAGGRLPRR
jgi:hypothetical protein